MGLENAKRLNAIIHSQKDDRGKSLHGVKHGERLHAHRDEQGRSLHTLKRHEKKNQDGKSLCGLNLAEKVNSQKWKCLITGKVTNPGALSKWQKARGIDTTLRVRIS